MELLESIFKIDVLLATFRLAIPIAIPAIGVSFCERSGVINLGVEGMMLCGALSAVVGSYFTGSAWIGVIIAMLVGGFVAWIHALISIKFKGNQTVSGVGINLLASGLTVVIMKAIWGNDGMSGSVNAIGNINVPILCNIPYIGRIFTNQTPFLFLLILITVCAWYVFEKSAYGLRLKAIGDYPLAVQSVGVNVNRYRYAAVILSGVFAGIGGAYLSIGQNSLFVKEMVAGRGFLAIAANIFGGWNPIGSLVASAIFAFAQAVRLNLSAFDIPDQFIQMLPYLVTLAVLLLTFKRKKAKGPEALGELLD